MADGEIVVKVEPENMDQVSSQMEQAQKDAQGNGGGGGGGLLDGLLGGDGQQQGGMTGGGGGGKGGGGMMDMISNMSGQMMAMLGGVMAIVGILLSMEPIQKLMKAFMKVIQAFFIPLAMGLIKLLMPVMRFMLKLLPAWLQFWQDPIGNISDALSSLWGWMKSKLPGLIWNLVKKIPEMLWAYYVELPLMIWGFIQQLAPMVWDLMKQLPGMIWSFMKKLPNLIASALGGAISDAGSWLSDNVPGLQSGGVVTGGGLFRLHTQEAVIPLDRLERIMKKNNRDQNNLLQVNLEGDASDFISMKEVDPNLP